MVTSDVFNGVGLSVEAVGIAITGIGLYLTRNDNAAPRRQSGN